MILLYALTSIKPAKQTLEIATVYRRYWEITDKNLFFSLQRCLSFFFQTTAVCKLNLWIYVQYFYSRGCLNKILVCDPLCFTLFFFCFPAFSFWWIGRRNKGKYILVAQFPSVYCSLYFSLIFLFLLDILLCIPHLKIFFIVIGYHSNRKGKTKVKYFYFFHAHFNMLLISNPSLSGPISVQWYQLFKQIFFSVGFTMMLPWLSFLNFIAESIRHIFLNVLTTQHHKYLFVSQFTSSENLICFHVAMLIKCLP